MAYPLAVAAISLLFALATGRQYAARRRPYQLVWTIALGMSAIASIAYLFAHPPGSSAAAFRAYYLFGAALMPAWLGLGSLLLLDLRKAAQWVIATFLAVSALAAGSVLQASIDPARLAALDGGPGTGVLQPGPWLPLTIVLNTAGVTAVVGVAILSGVQVLRRRGTGRVLLANLLIAAGDLMVGIAGSLARTGHPELFWVTMLAGWIVIFVGFLLTVQPATTGYRFSFWYRPA